MGVKSRVKSDEISKISTFSSFNVQGLVPKTKVSTVPYIRDILYDKNQCFISLTETWLHNHKTAEFDIPGYKCFHADRNMTNRSKKGRCSGGVAAYVRNDIAASMSELLVFSNGMVEAQCMYSNVENLCIINIYRQPDNQIHHSTSKEFADALDEISGVLRQISSPIPNIIFTGDFNLPNVNWQTASTLPGVPSVEKHCFLKLKLFIEENFLTQIVLQPTHIHGNTLDLVFTNNDRLVFDYQCIETLQSVSHHKIVEIQTAYQYGSHSLATSRNNITAGGDGNCIGNCIGFDQLNFHDESINWSLLCEELQTIDWDCEFKDLNLDEIAVKLNQLSLNCAIKYVPLKKSSQKGNRIPRERRLLMARRRRINKRLLRLTSPSNKASLRAELVEIEKKLQKSYQSTRDASEAQAVKNIKKNSKFFYAFANKFSKVKSSIGPLKRGDEIVTDNSEMADMLAHQFASVYSVPKENLPSANILFTDLNSMSGLSDIPCESNDMIEALGSLKEFSGSGPDRFPAVYLKKCKSQFAVPLCILWKKSLAEGYIPKCFKHTDILPLFKKGSVGCSENYRPIANSSHIIKVFEKIVRKYIVSYLDANNMFNPNQHGFRCNRSCLSQLLAHYDEILHQMEKGLGIDVVYLDFSKAFDKVDFHVLLKKLKRFGIDGKLGKWLYSFLVDRTQTVVVNGVKSFKILVKSGVPQGSVLGPLLFLSLMTDIDAKVKFSSVSSFADDTRVCKGVSSITDVDHFQTDLFHIYNWAEDNNMVFNNRKFELLRYNTPKSIDGSFYLDCNDEVISSKNTITDLGVLMSDNGKFTEQVLKVQNSMKNMSCWVLRTFKTRFRDVMITSWKSLVLPLHDYCSQLWSPHRPGEIQSLELLQWFFLKKIRSDVIISDYWEALDYYGIYSLQRRRERYQIIYVWKILEAIVPNPVIHSELSSRNFINCSISPRLGRRCIIPSIRSTSSTLVKNLRFNSFHIHGCRLFNVLPAEIRNFSNSSVEQFKYELDKFLSTVPDLPHLPGLRKFCPANSNSLIDMLRN